MPRFDDPFDFFRFTLWVIVTIYASIITLQSVYGLVDMLSGREKYISMIRRYLVIHMLRLRFTTFWGDVLICLLLSGVLGIIWWLHRLLERGMM